MCLLSSHKADDGGRGVLLGGRGGGVGPRHREEGSTAADDRPEHNREAVRGITPKNSFFLF